MSDKPKPITKVWMNGIEIALWKGEKGMSASIRKSWKDKEGNWKQTPELSMFLNDLPTLAYLCTRALDRAEAHREQSRPQSAGPHHELPPIDSYGRTSVMDMTPEQLKKAQGGSGWDSFEGYPDVKGSTQESTIQGPPQMTFGDDDIQF